MDAAGDNEAVWVMRPTGPWGDYGRILVHGMSSHLARVEGRLQLERTAPIVPPLSLPGIGHVVVTAALREQLENAKIAGMTFRALDKAHVVHLDWSAWDRSAADPAVHPASGEPEDYVLARPHDEAAAASLGDLWELVPYVGGRADRSTVSEGPRRYRYTLRPGTKPAADIFRAENMRAVFVTERLRRVLDGLVGGVVEFHPVG